MFYKSDGVQVRCYGGTGSFCLKKWSLGSYKFLKLGWTYKMS